MDHHIYGKPKFDTLGLELRTSTELIFGAVDQLTSSTAGWRLEGFQVVRTRFPNLGACLLELRLAWKDTEVVCLQDTESLQVCCKNVPVHMCSERARLEQV